MFSSMTKKLPGVAVDAHSGKAVSCTDAADEGEWCPGRRLSSLPPGSLVSELVIPGGLSLLNATPYCALHDFRLSAVLSQVFGVMPASFISHLQTVLLVVFPAKADVNY